MSDRPSKPGRYAIFPGRNDKDDPKTSGERRARARAERYTSPDDWEAFDRDELTPVQFMPQMPPSSDPPPLPEYQDLPSTMARVAHRARECAARDTEAMVTEVLDRVEKRMRKWFWLVAVSLILAAVAFGAFAQETRQLRSDLDAWHTDVTTLRGRVSENDKAIAVIKARNGFED